MLYLPFPHEDYALRAIKFNALDYLLKPIQEDELIKKNSHNKPNSLKIFLRTIRKLNSADNEVDLPTVDGLIFVKLAEIIRCEANNRNTDCFLTDNSMITLTCYLKDVEYFQEAHFLRVCYTTIINLQHIKQYIKEDGRIAFMNDGDEDDILAGAEDEFKQRLDQLKTVFYKNSFGIFELNSLYIRIDFPHVNNFRVYYSR